MTNAVMGMSGRTNMWRMKNFCPDGVEGLEMTKFIEQLNSAAILKVIVLSKIRIIFFYSWDSLDLVAPNLPHRVCHSLLDLVSGL